MPKHPEHHPSCPGPDLETCQQEGHQAEFHPDHEHAQSWTSAMHAAKDAKRGDPQERRVYDVAGQAVMYIKYNEKADTHTVRYSQGSYFSEDPQMILIPHVEPVDSDELLDALASIQSAGRD